MREIEFHALTKEDKPLLDRYFRANYYENSHFNFTNLYMWREPFHVHVAEEDDVLYVVSEWKARVSALQPFCDPARYPEATKKLLAYFEEIAQPFHIYDMERGYADFLRSCDCANFEVVADRDNYDYVYLSEKLISLSGRKLHSKKNHLNAFRKEHPDAQFLPITDEIVTQCKLELNSWYKQHRQEDGTVDLFIDYERTAILEVLNNFADFGLKGGAILLDGRVVAFTFGEQLNTDTAVIHVEKADPEVRGAYPAINQGFVEHAWSHLTYINREEDMGIEGLRKAKESYKPEKLIEKFNATLVGFANCS
ncbi:DUF2156 domain-containing protein [Selenomonas noxia]|uniref:DUF2156 domain-containing protein n=1 Tax=Selenomonas noxia TaxID=135083 RepID=UPI00287FF552|nr:phosphatidylglycerol lysyltransferase domain-containing protein [Selenomonas noxia]